MLIEDMAANIEDESPQTDSPTVDNRDETITRVVAKRLSEEKEKVRKEALDEHAISLGYSNYGEYMEAQMDNKLIEQSLDPKEIKPVLQELLQQSPEYQEALKYKKEKEMLEQQIWGQNELKRLNDEFGTNYKDISELDENTIKLWNSGLLLSQAYAANNYKSVIKKPTQPVNSGKEHLRNISGGGEASPAKKSLSAMEMTLIKNMYPNMSDEDILKRLK